MKAIGVRLIRAALAVALSGAMWFLSNGIHHVWILAWLAPIPVLLVLLELCPGKAGLTAFLASTLGALSFVVAYGSFPIMMRISLLTIFTVPFLVVASAWRVIARRGRPVMAVLTFPALVVAAEYLLSLFSPNGTFGSISYSQGDVPVVLQIASVTGIWGVSFLLTLVPASLAGAWRFRRERKTAAALLAIGALPIGLCLIFGAVRLAGPPPAAHVRVGLASSDAEVGRHFSTQAAEALPVVQANADRAAELAKQGAQIIVLPEKFVGITAAYADRALAILSDAARDNGVMIIAGFNYLSLEEKRNVAVVFGADGKTVLKYDKQHFVPNLENGYRRGKTVGFIGGLPVASGIAICKDLDFAPLGRAYARRGVGLLFVPAWDFVNDGWLHSRMAVLRGVEGGFAVARSAANGRLTVSDARGRIVAERISSESDDVLLTADVSIGPGGTFYSRTGDWFAWLCLVAVFVCFAYPRKKSA